MKTLTPTAVRLAVVVTLSELAGQLGVTVQTLYDLRSQGRGPQGFRVGRELRFHVQEVDAWLAQMEDEDADRHPRRDQHAPRRGPCRGGNARSLPRRSATAGEASGRTAAAARSRLVERIRERPSLPSAGVLRPTSSFADLAALWLADFDLRDLAGNTKENYRTCVRLHLRPAFAHYTMAEVTTGRVERLLASQANVSPSQVKQTRTMLNLLVAYALRHDSPG